MITVGKLISACDEVILCNKTNSNTEGRITLMYTIELIIITTILTIHIYKKFHKTENYAGEYDIFSIFFDEKK